MDRQEITLIVLRDLSAAFDTIDHQILLKELENDFGITGSAHKWFASYLSGRKQRVLVNDLHIGHLSLKLRCPTRQLYGTYFIYIIHISTMIQMNI